MGIFLTVRRHVTVSMRTSTINREKISLCVFFFSNLPQVWNKNDFFSRTRNGRIERYICTIEDGIQTLLADSKLPPLFWGDAALTFIYLRNRLPTSTLPDEITPYEVMNNSKPDLSHLQVWGCQCFPIIPPEQCTKGGPRRHEAILVRYEENRIGWRVRDLHGKYFFSRDF